MAEYKQQRIPPFSFPPQHSFPQIQSHAPFGTNRLKTAFLFCSCPHLQYLCTLKFK